MFDQLFSLEDLIIQAIDQIQMQDIYFLIMNKLFIRFEKYFSPEDLIKQTIDDQRAGLESSTAGFAYKSLCTSGKVHGLPSA